MSIVKVCCAIIQKNHYILAVQRADTMSNPLKWEFPGGKLQAHETEQDCIVREVQEELGLSIQPNERLESSVHHYSKSLSIELVPFLCEILSGSLKLAEHKEHLWLKPHELSNLDWSEADLPIVKSLSTIE